MPNDPDYFDETPVSCPSCEDGTDPEGNPCTRCDGDGEICRGDLTDDELENLASAPDEPDWDADDDVQHARAWPEYHGLI